MKTIAKKLRSRKGESIAEVLVALLISVLGVMLLVGMINASSRIIINSTEEMHKRYAKANANVSSSGTVDISGTNVSISSLTVKDYQSEGEVVFYLP